MEQEGNKYPRPYQSKKVITRDEYGAPLLTRFFLGANATGNVAFEWLQVNSTTGMINFAVVKSKDVLTPPDSNETGDRYWIGGVGAGVWADKDYQIAEWSGSVWEYTLAALGLPSSLASLLTPPNTDVAAEAFTSSHDEAVALAHSSLNNTLVVVTKEGTTYTVDTDYTVDYLLGKITVLSTGSMLDVTEYTIAYSYLTGTVGDQYWIEGTGTDKWTDKDYQVAEWDGAAWTFTETAAVAGILAYVTDSALTFFYDGTSLKVFKEGIELDWSLQNINTTN
jgi:hypothetical protein